MPTAMTAIAGTFASVGMFIASYLVFRDWIASQDR